MMHPMPAHLPVSRSARRPDVRRRFALAIALAILLAPSVYAAEIEGVVFDDEIVVSSSPPIPLKLNGMGLLRYRVLFKGYVAALYLPSRLPSRVSGTGVLGDTPRRLELSYFWSIGAKDFGNAADTLLRRDLSESEFEEIRVRLDRLHAAYRDVDPNDRYSLTYVPEIGTELRLNDELLASIPGEDFADAYFGIWLGDQPLDAGLRADLLGRR